MNIRTPSKKEFTPLCKCLSVCARHPRTEHARGAGRRGGRPESFNFFFFFKKARQNCRRTATMADGTSEPLSEAAAHGHVEPPERKLSPTLALVAAGMAGVGSKALTHPFDTLRAQMQVGAERGCVCVARG